MIGWVTATVLWLLGIYPAYTGAVEVTNNDPELAEDDTGVAKAVVIAVAIFWPVAALVELVASIVADKEDPNGQRE